MFLWAFIDERSDPCDLGYLGSSWDGTRMKRTLNGWNSERKFSQLESSAAFFLARRAKDAPMLCACFESISK